MSISGGFDPTSVSTRFTASPGTTSFGSFIAEVSGARYASYFDKAG